MTSGAQDAGACLLLAAKAMSPTIAEWRDTAERERRLPEALVQALRNARLFESAVHPTLGGAGLDELALVEMVDELASHDGSVGWNVMIAANGARIAAHLPESGVRDIYADTPSVVIAGSLLPKGIAEPTPGGYYVTGRWSMVSGCQYAEWIRAPAMVDGTAQARLFHVPGNQCKILDTWRTTGLRGTGSHDLSIDHVFVPERRSVELVMAGHAVPGSLHYNALSTRARPLMAAVALGIARDAVASFVRMPRDSAARVTDQHYMHEKVARAEALVRAGRAYLYASVLELANTPDWSDAIIERQHADIRLAAAYTTRNAVEAVDLLFDAAGGGSIYQDNRLELCFRNVHTLIHHVGVAGSNFQTIGKYLIEHGQSPLAECGPQTQQADSPRSARYSVFSRPSTARARERRD